MVPISRRTGEMPVEVRLESVIQAIRHRVPACFSGVRAQLVASSSDLICTVGESIRPIAGTWYLSVLVSADSDEVSATVDARDVDGGTTVSADICIGARLILERKERLTCDDDLVNLVRLLDQYLEVVPELIVSAVAELEQGTSP
jgi:hypothetical protein